MIRFLLLSVILLVILLATGIGVQAYASTQPDSEALTSVDLKLCGGKLCFKGITPGVTSTQQVHTLFSQGEGSNFYLITDTFFGSAITFGPTVMEVTVRPNADKPLITAGQMVRLLGQPTTVTAGATPDTIILQYTGVSVEVARATGSSARFRRYVRWICLPSRPRWTSPTSGIARPRRRWWPGRALPPGRSIAGSDLGLSEMIRLSILAILLVLALIVLIGVTAANAHGQPDANRFAALGFDTCEDRPCFLGIAPRLTGWTDALKLGIKQGGLQAEAGDAADIVFDQQRQHVTVARSVNSRLVYYVNVTLGALRYNLSAGEMAQRYGMPCKVVFDTADSIVVLVYPYMTVTASTPDWHLTPQSPVKEIDLSDPSLDYQPMHDLCVVYHDSANWAGFASAQYYTINRLRAS